MILISYVKPYIIIRSDKVISGRLFIVGNSKKVLWTDEFLHKDFLSVKIKKDWKEKIEVIVEADNVKCKKIFQFG